MSQKSFVKLGKEQDPNDTVYSLKKNKLNKNTA